MTKKIRDIMTPAPMGMTPVESVASAARIMRDAGIGTVLVLNDGDLALWLDEGSALSDIAAAPPNT